MEDVKGMLRRPTKVRRNILRHTLLWLCRQTKRELEKMRNLEEHDLGLIFDYAEVVGLSGEVKEKLNKTKPKNLLEASGVEGITPAALNVLAIHLKKLMQSEQAETLKKLANLIAEKNKQHNLTSAKTRKRFIKTT